jgi:hypothetical protein
MLLKVNETGKAIACLLDMEMTINDAEKRPGRILLSGASGMVGTALRQSLATRHTEMVRLVRRAPEGSDELQWTPAGQAPIANLDALEGVHAAIHLSGANLAARRWTPKYRREMASSRIDSTRALAKILAGRRHPPHAFLMASAIGIYGDRGDELLDEESSPGAGLLPDLCRAWEAAAQPAVQAGIRVVHLRFGVVLDSGAGALAQMLPLFRFGLGGRLGSGKQWMSWISLADVVKAVLFAVEEPSMRGAVNLVSPQPVTNAEFTRTLARQLHRPALLPAPAFALRLAFGQMADDALLASTCVVPARLLGAGFRFAHDSLNSALADLLS